MPSAWQLFLSLSPASSQEQPPEQVQPRWESWADDRSPSCWPCCLSRAYSAWPLACLCFHFSTQITTLSPRLPKARLHPELHRPLTLPLANGLLILCRRTYSKPQLMGRCCRSSSLL